MGPLFFLRSRISFAAHASSSFSSTEDRSSSSMDPRILQLRALEPDTSTYMGRTMSMVYMTDPRHMFLSKERIDQAVKLLRAWENGTLSPEVTAEEIFEAKKIQSSAIHPDTGETIFLPFRFCSAVPMNTIVVAMMLVARTTPAVITSQWLNQSVNVGFNWANRNASNHMSTEDIAKSYFSAVAASVFTAVGLNKFVEKSVFSPATKATLLRFTPFAAVAMANILNVGLMRSVEMTDGISVIGEDGKVLGKSPTVGKVAVGLTIAVRIISAIPIMVVVPMIMGRLERVRSLQNNSRAIFLLNCLLVAAGIFFVLPPSLALFPQTSSLSVKYLEPEFQNRWNQDGTPVQVVIFNKGL